VATEAALRAGAIQRERYGHTLEVAHKGSIDLVTDVDRACEEAILDTLRARCPAHDVVTEEQVLAQTGARHRWFVDPLDGTTNYAHGYPLFCASIALAIDGAVVAAAVYEPLKQELFTAERGSGAHLNGRRLRVSRTDELIRAMLVTGFPYDVHERLEEALRLFNRFIGLARAIRRDGAAALDICYVAAGRMDGFWEERLKPWDALAAALVLEEAGGRVSRFDGAPLELTTDEVLATNGKVHEAMLRVIAEDRAAQTREAQDVLA